MKDQDRFVATVLSFLRGRVREQTLLPTVEGVDYMIRCGIDPVRQLVLLRSQLEDLRSEGRDWFTPERYRRVLEYAGVSRSLMRILALEEGRADELSRKGPRELFRWVMEARGIQQVLERYNFAHSIPGFA